MKRPRIAVIAIGVALGLSGGMALGGGAFWYFRYYGFYAAYKWDFDHCLWLYRPLLAGILRNDEALREEIETKQRLAFDHGGIDAANQMAWNIMNSRLMAAAGDDAIRSCHVAYTGAYRALLAHPRLCRQMMRGDISQDYAGPGSAELGEAHTACDAAAQDGERHQDTPPPYLYGAAWDAAMARINAGPVAFSPEERGAMAHPDSASDAAACSEALKWSQNTEAISGPEGASFMRSEYTASDSQSIVDITPQPGSPPDDALHCAASGTRFILNNFLQDGRPNSWTSLGRHGFDCGLLSAATGKRGLFFTLNEDMTEAHVPNPLRALWPLAVGKSASITYVPINGQAEETHVKVDSLKSYWLPRGRVDAYAIDREIRAGHYHYRVIDYWAPSLGFTIGRRASSISSVVPDYEGQDYQLVAILPPNGL